MKRFIVQKIVNNRYCKHADFQELNDALLCVKLAAKPQLRIYDRTEKKYIKPIEIEKEE